MIGLLRQTKAFTVPFFILVGLSSILLLFYNKIEIELWINARNSPLFDIFFKYFTHLGDGVTAAIVSLVLILCNIRKGFILLLSYLISGLAIQMLKIHVFPDVLRPIGMIEMTPAIHLVEGVKLWGIQSFPSGHSATAFAVFYCFAAFTNNRNIQILSLTAAVLLAYSRLYLFQHFLNDVVAGAVLGTFTSMAFIIMFDHWNLMSRLNKSVFSLMRKSPLKT